MARWFRSGEWVNVNRCKHKSSRFSVGAHAGRPSTVRLLVRRVVRFVGIAIRVQLLVVLRSDFVSRVRASCLPVGYSGPSVG
jgi:hypothetical protein